MAQSLSKCCPADYPFPGDRLNEH